MLLSQTAVNIPEWIQYIVGAFGTLGIGRFTIQLVQQYKEYKIKKVELSKSDNESSDKDKDRLLLLFERSQQVEEQLRTDILKARTEGLEIIKKANLLEVQLASYEAQTRMMEKDLELVHKQFALAKERTDFLEQRNETLSSLLKLTLHKCLKSEEAIEEAAKILAEKHIDKDRIIELLES